MDLFGHKSIAQLEYEIARLQRREAELIPLRSQIEYLVRTIRDMDQEIWNMGQQTSWEGMRPYYIKIQEGTIARKHAESNRIGDILRGELIDTYAPDAAKRIGKS